LAISNRGGSIVKRHIKRMVPPDRMLRPQFGEDSPSDHAPIVGTCEI